MTARDYRTEKAYWLSPDGINRLKGWALDGMSDQDIAEKIGIAKSTFHAWQNADDAAALLDALDWGREIANRNVENALYRRAVGYPITETKVVSKSVVVDGCLEDVTETTVAKKDLAPDTLAIIFWLKNRRRDQYRDRHDVDVSGSVGMVTIVDDLTE